MYEKLIKAEGKISFNNLKIKFAIDRENKTIFYDGKSKSVDEDNLVKFLGDFFRIIRFWNEKDEQLIVNNKIVVSIYERDKTYVYCKGDKYLGDVNKIVGMLELLFNER